jgi:hypothetical protein
VEINNGFAKFSEALVIAEKTAREAISARIKVG